MISLIIIISILVFNISIILILKRNKISLILPKWILLIFTVITLVGLFLILWQDTEINNELIKRTWLNTEGEIIDSKIAGERALHAEILYLYKIENKTYKGNSDYNIPGFGSKNYRRKQRK